jgi:hypothetical protein
MRRNDLAFSVFALSGFHRMAHQDAHVGHVAGDGGPDSHRF